MNIIKGPQNDIENDHYKNARNFFKKNGVSDRVMKEVGQMFNKERFEDQKISLLKMIDKDLGKFGDFNPNESANYQAIVKFDHDRCMELIEKAKIDHTNETRKSGWTKAGC